MKYLDNRCVSTVDENPGIPPLKSICSEKKGLFNFINTFFHVSGPNTITTIKTIKKIYPNSCWDDLASNPLYFQNTQIRLQLLNLRCL